MYHNQIRHIFWLLTNILFSFDYDINGFVFLNVGISKMKNNYYTSKLTIVIVLLKYVGSQILGKNFDIFNKNAFI